MTNTQYRVRGIIGTIVFHLFLVLLLVVFGFSTPLPLPAEKGILINFGNSDDGMGAEEPRMQDAAPTPQQAKASKPSEESPLTQTHEEAPSLPAPKKESTKKEQTKSKTETPTTQPTQNTQTTQTNTEEKPKVNHKALFPGQKTTGGNTGEGETGKPGIREGLRGRRNQPTVPEQPVEVAMPIGALLLTFRAELPKAFLNLNTPRKRRVAWLLRLLSITVETLPRLLQGLEGQPRSIMNS